MTTTNIEDTAQDLMDINNMIWDMAGYRSGADVEKDKIGFQTAVKNNVEGKVSQEVVDILEDNNYHSFVEALHDSKLIQK